MTKKLELTSEISSDIETMLMNGMPLTQICQKPGSPSLSKVYEWIRSNKEFADKILLSRRIAAQTYLDRMITELENADSSNIQVVKEKLQHYRWLSSKLIAIYGDKQQVNVDQKIEIKWSDEDKTFENEIKNVSSEAVELGS